MASLALAFDILAKDKASDTFDKVGNSADRSGGKVAGFGKTFATLGKTVALGAVAIGAGALALGKGFVDAAVESQKVTKQTEAVIKSMGGVANVTAKQVGDLAGALAMKTGVDDELIQSGQNVLLTFANVRNEAGKGPKTFDRATKAALDMSVALGTDMTSAAMMVGKALNDPTEGLSKLARSGIQFTDQQKDQIKVMQEAGDTAGAQAIMLAELERQFGGSAEAQATAGDRLRVVWGNLQEQLGERLLPVVERVSGWLAEKLPAALDAAEPYINDAIELFKNIGTAVREFVENSLQSLRSWWDEHGPAITEAVKGFAEDFVQYVLTPMGDVATFIKDEVIPRFGEFITWILENEGVLKGLGVLVGVTLVAHFGALATAAVVSAVATAAAWASATLPIVAMIGLVGALVAATQWAINTNAFKGFLDWFDDIANAASRLFGFLAGIIPQINAMIGLARAALGFVDRLPGGPSQAKVDPLTGRKIPQAHSGGHVTAHGIEPLRSDELLTKLQVGETVLPKGAGIGDQSRHIGQIVVQTTASPRAWIDEFLWQGAGL